MTACMCSCMRVSVSHLVGTHRCFWIVRQETAIRTATYGVFGKVSALAVIWHWYDSACSLSVAVSTIRSQNGLSCIVCVISDVSSHHQHATKRAIPCFTSESRQSSIPCSDVLADALVLLRAIPHPIAKRRHLREDEESAKSAELSSFLTCVCPAGPWAQGLSLG